MTVVVTRNVPARFRGFLASCMLEIAPGVYVAPRLNRAVRSRVWQVLVDWFDSMRIDGSIVMTYRDKDFPGGTAVLTLGSPPVEIVEVSGLYCVRKSAPKPPEVDQQPPIPF